MKRFISMFLVIGTAMIFFACQGDSLTDPGLSQSADQTDQAPTSLAQFKTPFTGTCNFVKDIDPGTATVLPNGKTLVEGIVSEWYDEASDPRVTGRTIWSFSMLLNEDGTGKLWGTAELIVDNNGGKWKTAYKGELTAEGAFAPVVGVGVEGDVKGLTEKWDYTMIYANGFFYVTEGFIIGHKKPLVISGLAK